MNKCSRNNQGIAAAEKLSTASHSVTKKIKEDDNEIGWNDIGDFEIGQKVPYKFESAIPDMNGYTSYYYAWHDIMDNALTLQENSIKIKISGTVDGESKVYELGTHEFSLVTENIGSDTFQIKVADMKAIVDREFPQFNNQSENVYGQKVTLTYDAVLNEKAAENTGRPGFENDVRLEFSNDPNQTGAGKTGYTPWDTVVCFTYRVDGVKSNNKGKNLANAKFKLYYDENCTEEVFIKENETGYCVVHEDSSALVVAADRTEIVSDDKGEFAICGLDSGTYYLKETQAPEGYRPLLEPIEISIASSFPEKRNEYVKGTGATEAVLNLSANGKITTFVDGKESVSESPLTTNADVGSVVISVINQISAKLPMTGSYAMPLLIGVGGISVFMGIKTSKKKQK